MLSREWQDAGLVYSVPNGVLEDFTVIRQRLTRTGEGDFMARFCAGPSLQDQRLYRAWGASPLGPWSDVEPGPCQHNAHTRLYRTADDEGLLVSAVWPGLPKAGIWRFEDIGDGLHAKSLLIAPKDGTLYSIAAVNPCSYFDGEHWNVYFEGRNETVFWRLFHAVADRDWSNVRVFDEPLRDGANPSILEHDGTVYLYYSHWIGHGFETRCMTQPVKR